MCLHFPSFFPMNSPMRRSFLTFFAACVFGATTTFPAPTLNESAPFPIGVGLSDRIANRPQDWPLLKAQFNSVTPENCMKPDPIQREQGRWAWELPDSFVNFAHSNNLKVVGHCLVWAKDDRTPPWFAVDGERPSAARSCCNA